MTRMIEVDEEEFLRNEKLRKTVASWMANPASKRKLLEAHKAFDPKADIPELDQPDPIDAKLSPVLSEVESLKKQIAETATAREQKEKLAEFGARIELGFDKLRREENLTQTGEEAVRKLMEEEGITNPEVAWSHFQRLHPPQAPVTPGGQGGWNFLDPIPDDQVDIKNLIASKGESIPLVDKMARDALAEIRGQRR